MVYRPLCPDSKPASGTGYLVGLFREQHEILALAQRAEEHVHLYALGCTTGGWSFSLWEWDDIACCIHGGVGLVFHAHSLALSFM